MTVELTMPDDIAELAIPEEPRPVAVRAPEPPMSSPLLLWAAEAQQASLIAKSLARTAFVPASMRGKHDNPDTAHEITIGNVTAAILTGQELGLQPMAAMRSMDIIQGTPALRAHAMRGLVQSKGHKVELVGEATAEKVVMRGKRKGERAWQTVEWTLRRAAQLGLTGKDQWKKQPQTMLIARATGEICRLIAADVLFAMPYASEELDPRTAAFAGSSVAPPVTAEEILSAVEPVEPTAVEPGEADEYDTDFDDEIMHDGHAVGEYDPWCVGCQAESREADRKAASEA